MTLHTWWLFVMMSFVVCGTPGPNMLLMLTCAVSNLATVPPPTSTPSTSTAGLLVSLATVIAPAEPCSFELVSE